ncbi:MAG: VWA domain-containing protein [Chloroflexi bacterium]|nr:VWA domain-containing protein [Chloroflexota bacterium]
MQLSFDRPLAFALIPVAFAVVILVWRASRAYLPSGRRWALLGVRLLAVTLLVCALAVPSLQLPANNLDVAVLLDHSDSISPAQRATEDQWLEQALAQKGVSDQVAVISFAGDATLDQPLSTDSTPPVFPSDETLNTASTDIAAAIRLGLASLPSDAARRLVLLTDGDENSEQATQAAALAAAAGVQLDVVPLEQDSTSQALVESLDAPARLRQGESFSVAAQVRSTAQTDATLYLQVDGDLTATQQVQLEPGTARFVMNVDPLTAGHHVVQVHMDTPADAQPENKTAGAYVVVDGPPRVLIVEGSPGDGQYLAQALQTAGVQVDVVSGQAAPLQPDQLSSYASVVLANVSADVLAPDELQALQQYVQQQGGGLLVTGGDNSYAPGGYARTPLETMLPVRMDLHGATLSPSTALVLAIDTSGSMSQSISGVAIMDAAKQAAMAAAQSLGPADQIGVIAFQAPNSFWVVQPTAAADLDAIGEAVAPMNASGGDDSIQNVLQLAYDGLAGSDAHAKHVILLTDGETPSGDYQSVTQQMAAANITVSTIGFGAEINTPLLQDVARLGQGGYYEGNDLWNLPQLVVKETQQAERSAIVEQDVHALTVNSDPSLGSVDMSQAPPLRGYIATTPKPQSTVLYASPNGDPLLVEWQLGLGRVMAWTSDVSNRWSANWLTWPGFEQFWAQVVNRTLRPAADPDRQVTIALQGDQAQITLDAETGVESGQPAYVNSLPTSATVIDPKGATQQVALPQVAPGEYRGSAPAGTTGVYGVDVTETNSDGSVETQSSGFVVPYSPEYRDLGTNDTLLSTLATQTGGHVLDTASDAFAHNLQSVSAPQPISAILLAIVALLFVVDVGLRRLRGSRALLGDALARVRGQTHTSWYGESAHAAPRPAPVTHVAIFSSRPRPTSQPDPVARPSPAQSQTAPIPAQRLLAARRRASRQLGDGVEPRHGTQRKGSGSL